MTNSTQQHAQEEDFVSERVRIGTGMTEDRGVWNFETRTREET